ncbi:MAG: hypothetical protein ACYDIA_01670 [Candidatus Humimicrobiaceae bacterium]
MGIEDEIKIEDVLKEPTETVVAKIYIQALKTNGIVKQHDKDIISLKAELKGKINTKIFSWGCGIVGFIIILFQVLDYFKR